MLAMLAMPIPGASSLTLNAPIAARFGTCSAQRTAAGASMIVDPNTMAAVAVYDVEMELRMAALMDELESASERAAALEAAASMARDSYATAMTDLTMAREKAALAETAAEAKVAALQQAAAAQLLAVKEEAAVQAAMMKEAAAEELCVVRDEAGDLCAKLDALNEQRTLLVAELEERAAGTTRTRVEPPMPSPSPLTNLAPSLPRARVRLPFRQRSKLRRS